MKIINASGIVLGRLASYVAKEALKGEEVAVINCSEVIITGNKEMLRKKFEEKRRKVGTLQKGPKYSLSIEKIVKRTIRGMIPNHRTGRGRETIKKIKCYEKIPKELENKEITNIKQNKKIKTNKLIDFTKK